MAVTADPRRLLEDAIGRARAHSPFLKLQFDKFPSVAGPLAQGDVALAIGVAQEAGAGAGSVATRLRRERSALSLALGVGDLAGLLTLEQVVGTLSDLADRAAEEALAEAFAWRTPDAE